MVGILTLGTLEDAYEKGLEPQASHLERNCPNEVSHREEHHDVVRVLRHDVHNRPVVEARGPLLPWTSNPIPIIVLDQGGGGGLGGREGQ